MTTQVNEMTKENPVFSEIQSIVDSNEIVLFMKGNKMFPQCGFSAVVNQILQNYGLEYKDINVLEDFDIRQGIKDFSQWPTIPQLYVKGEFIGGCDIVREMVESGEFEDLLKSKDLL